MRPHRAMKRRGNGLKKYSQVPHRWEFHGRPLRHFFGSLQIPSCPENEFRIEEATEIVDQWLNQPNVRLLVPGDGHWTLLKKILVEGQAHGPLITDAQLAALTIEFGGVLHTTDRDFARFPGLRWTNPLA